MCVYVSACESLYDNNFGDYNVGVHYHIIYMCGAYIYITCLRIKF